eukprot:880867-Pyramimonas_sp.AAC.1
MQAGHLESLGRSAPSDYGLSEFDAAHDVNNHSGPLSRAQELGETRNALLVFILLLLPTTVCYSQFLLWPIRADGQAAQASRSWKGVVRFRLQHYSFIIAHQH